MLGNRPALEIGREAFHSVRGLASLHSEVNSPLPGQGHPSLPKADNAGLLKPSVASPGLSCLQRARDRQSRSGL